MKRRQFMLSSLLAATPPPPPPNIVIIYCDDLGYADTGPYGGSIATPNLNKLAAEGMRFTHWTSANPVCSPSRAALLTGRYPTRTGVPSVLFPADTAGLDLRETTLAQALQPRGYRTMCAGKWHLGHTPRYLPTARGFDEYFGIPYSNDMTPRPLLHNTETVEPEARLDTLTRRYTEQAVKFIDESKPRPFFLYLAHTMPHIPLAASDRFRGKSAQGLYGDVIQEIDWSVGEVMQAVRRRGLESNTLVMFSSDNGPWYQGSAGRLRGRKGFTWEGGVREPFLARMPGRIPAGRTCHSLCSMMDVFPTVTRLAGASLPSRPVDGIDVWPLLSGEKTELEREALLYFDGWHLQCARRGKWKAHFARYTGATYSPAPAGGRANLPLPQPELYDVVTDTDESYDVAPEHPDIVRDLEARTERLVAGFPEEVRKDWAATRAQRSKGAVGAYPSKGA
jgi:arylsulfatase A